MQRRMNTGSRRKPFTLREWARLHRFDLNKFLNENMVVPTAHAELFKRWDESGDDMVSEMAKAFGIKELKPNNE